MTDSEGYARYTARTPAVAAAHGGRLLVCGGAVEPGEGAPSAGRVVVVEFPDTATARRCCVSPEHRAILPLRLAASRGRTYLVEGA